MPMYAATFDKLSSHVVYFQAESDEEADVTANKIIYQIQNDTSTQTVTVDGQTVEVETGISDIVSTTFIDPIY